MLQRITNAIVFCGLLALPGPIVAQQSSWQPTKSFPFLLYSPSVAKIYDGGNEAPILGLVIFSVKTTQEVREREILDPKTGKSVTQTYSVMVPVLKNGRQEFQQQKFELPLANAKIWNSSGELLDADAARKALATPKRCLYTGKQMVNSLEDPIDNFHAAIFRSDVYFILYDFESAKELDLRSGD